MDNLNSNSRHDFQKAKEHIETLATTKDKILYMNRVLTDFRQNKTGLEQFEQGFLLSPSFERKCELEIEGLNRELKLEMQLESQKQTKAETKETIAQLQGYTNAQLVLIFYYFFTHSGLEPRVDIDIAPIAKFLHLIAGKEFTTTTNSDFYKKLQKVPNFKSDKELIKDLEIVKTLFQKVKLNEIVKMIENEIETARLEAKKGRKREI